ncbi:putative mitochondrial protein [Cucumis melo var. makuwa]|uniref:Mitochondrial protein n=1 Tax=Cucumis melo var. makuwa TaxID=1194695 RepID=A0A5A7UCW1_CUCMM|nr:putative mitochondrial protein [Cucumis melo var. makuwa]
MVSERGKDETLDIGVDETQTNTTAIMDATVAAAMEMLLHHIQKTSTITSSRAWFDRFTIFVKSQGYNQGHSNHTLFTKVFKAEKIVVLIVYVDDIVILSGDDIVEIIQMKKRMGNEFEIKDLENLKYFLGMEVARSKEGISVPQRKYTFGLLTQASMLEYRYADTPIEFNYISYVVSVVSQFMQAPYEKHMEAFNKILRYLKTTLGKGLMFRKKNMKAIEAYTDSDHTGSKKQGVVTRRSAETKYGVMSLGISEEIWLKKVLFDLHQDCEVSMKLFCDNKAVISIVNDPVQHDRNKHVEID